MGPLSAIYSLPSASGQELGTSGASNRVNVGRHGSCMAIVVNSERLRYELARRGWTPTAWRRNRE